MFNKAKEPVSAQLQYTAGHSMGRGGTKYSYHLDGNNAPLKAGFLLGNIKYKEKQLLKLLLRR